MTTESLREKVLKLQLDILKLESFIDHISDFIMDLEEDIVKNKTMLMELFTDLNMSLDSFSDDNEISH